MSVFDPDYDDEPDSEFGDGVDDTWLHVNDANKNGETELTRAARLGLTARVTRLLAVDDIDVNVADKRGRTALMWAVNGVRTQFNGEFMEIAT